MLRLHGRQGGRAAEGLVAQLQFDAGPLGSREVGPGGSDEGHRPGDVAVVEQGLDPRVVGQGDRRL